MEIENTTELTLKRRVRRRVKRILKKTIFYKPVMAVIKTRRIVNSPTYFPQYERKNKLWRYYDCYKWVFKYKRHNPSYNLYGLDVKNFRSCDDYVDIKYVKKDRMKEHHEDDPLTQHRKENITIRYSLLADNKHVFYSYLEDICPDFIPKTHFVFQGDHVLAPLDIKDPQLTKNALAELEDGRYIAKATIGAFGKSVAVVDKQNGEILINNGEIPFDEWMEETKAEPYLLQEYIIQHEEINRINPHTVNTLRVITTRWNEKTNILAAMIRMGVEGQIVDNASDGGTFVGINIDTGKMMEYGYYYEKPREKCHPDTGFVYKDVQIPYWNETVELVTKLHPIIFGLSTIGWDVAITETGPKIVEMNWNYSIKGIQIACGGLKKRWDELKEK